MTRNVLLLYLSLLQCTVEIRHVVFDVHHDVHSLRKLQIEITNGRPFNAFCVLQHGFLESLQPLISRSLEKGRAEEEITYNIP